MTEFLCKNNEFLARKLGIITKPQSYFTKLRGVWNQLNKRKFDITTGQDRISGPRPNETPISYISWLTVAYQHSQLHPVTGKETGKTLWGSKKANIAYIL